jgi:hypothetical protein
MTGPMEEYLDQLRASLRTRPAETGRILAEAEDHLRESVAAGLRAGLTQVEAQQAAISAFGSVRAVVRAHQTRRARAVAVLSGCVMTSWKLTGLFLLAFSVTSLAGLADIKMAGHSTVPLTGPALQHLAAGIAGLLLLTGHHLVRRFRRRGTRAVAAAAARYFPLVAVTFFGAGTMAQVLLKISGAAPAGPPTILACLALAACYAVRIGRTLRPRGRTASSAH